MDRREIEENRNHGGTQGEYKEHRECNLLKKKDVHIVRSPVIHSLSLIIPGSQGPLHNCASPYPGQCDENTALQLGRTMPKRRTPT